MSTIAWVALSLRAGLPANRRDPPTLTRRRGGYQSPLPAAADQLVHQDKPPR